MKLLVAQIACEHTKTCKSFEHTTRRRLVWLDALHRVCLDNSLFLPSFPTPDMSDLELEQVAIAPHRWIKLSDTFVHEYSGDPGEILYPQTTRIFRNVAMRHMRHNSTHVRHMRHMRHMWSMPYLFLVPGGRYLVVS